MPTRIVLERDVDIPMSDGTVLRADVYRPDDAGTHPVLVQRTPYDKAFFPYTWVVLDPTKMAGAGYAVVMSDVRGRFASEGDFYPYVNEARDGHDTIEWAAGQPWSDGNVGTYGVSYMGQSQWLAAANGPPSLRCIATATSPHDAYHDLVHRGGALCLGVLASWSMVTIAPRELVRRASGNPNFLADFVGLVDDIDAVDKPLRSLPLVPFGPLRRGGEGSIMPLFEDDVRAEVREQRHEQMSSSDRHDRIEVPALQLAGWYDLRVQADLDHFTAIRERGATQQARGLSRILVGPWAHAGFAATVGMVYFGMRANGILLDLREDLTGLHRRWFDARLRGRPTGIDDEPPVKLFGWAQPVAQ